MDPGVREPILTTSVPAWQGERAQGAVPFLSGRSGRTELGTVRPWTPGSLSQAAFPGWAKSWAIEDVGV